MSKDTASYREDKMPTYPNLCATQAVQECYDQAWASFGESIYVAIPEGV